jgi:hypothetical protein
MRNCPHVLWAAVEAFYTLISLLYFNFLLRRKMLKQHFHFGLILDIVAYYYLLFLSFGKVNCYQLNFTLSITFEKGKRC